MTKLDRELQRIGEQLQRAGAELPEGYNLTINVEKGAGWIELNGPDFEDIEVNNDMVDGISYVIEGAIDSAIKHSQNNS